MLAPFARTLIALALVLMAASLWLSPQPAIGLVLAAGVALAGSLLLRGASPGGAGSARHDADSPASVDAASRAGPGHADTLLSCLAVASSQIAAAGSLGDALRKVRIVLEEELGAQGVRVFEVDACDERSASLRELDPASALLPGYRLPAVRLGLDSAGRRPLVAALANRLANGLPSGLAVGDGSLGYAVAVVAAGRTLAALELGGLTLDLPQGAMRRALATLAAQLGLFHSRDPAQAPHANGAATAGPAAAEPSSAEPAPEGLPPRFSANVIEALPLAVFIFACDDLRLIAINRRAETEFHLRRDDVVGRTLTQAFHPSLSKAVEPEMRRAIVERCEVTCDHDWSTSRGARTVHVHNVVLSDADGTPRWLVSTAREVTDERRAQRELIEAQSVLNQFADTVEESLFVSNLDRTVFHFLAGSLYDRWGVTREQMLEQPAAFLRNVVEEDRPLITERHAKEKALRPADTVFRIRHPGKGVRWLRSRTRSLQMPDGDIRVFGLVSDVTDDKVREEELRRTRNAAEAASTAKSQFMANMSHEIRTPMNGILGMTELLLGTRLADEQRRFAQAVYRSGESLLEIINDILDFSKIEAGRLELARSDFSLRSVVEDTLELLAPRAHEKGLDLSFLEADGLPSRLHGDALRLRQVLTNLVANAIKFTQSGEVAVELRRLPPQRQTAPGDGLWLEFEVRDTGIGIEPNVLPRLFSAFTQASGDMSRRYGGTGLGLAISKQLVELMGGDIRVKSAPGQGSSFCFSIQLQPSESGEGGTADSTETVNVLAACRVLVVEDHETNRVILENMLGSWGMQVTLATDGQEALDLLRARQGKAPGFDIALIDMQMPRIDGLSLAKALQHEGLCTEMRMIMLSSASSHDDARAAQLAGFLRFLPKPVRRAELRQALVSLAKPVHDRGALRARAPLLSGHVLVVEDNKVNQEVIGQMLRSMGLKVQIASGAMQGLRLLCEAHFDLVLMDIMMPGMDGIEGVSWFRRGTGGRFLFKTPTDTPVIAVTANALQGDEERFLSLGFSDYLSKPFRQNQLLAMLTKYLRPQAFPPVAEGAETAGSRGLSASVADAADAVDAVDPTPAPDPGLKRPSGVLDASALARLRDLDPSGSNRLMERVVLAFETSAGRLVPQARQACVTHDLESVRHVVHTLKSSSASMGALRLSRLCADLETMIRLGTVDDLERRVNQVCDEVSVVLQALTLETTVLRCPALNKPHER